MQRSHKAEGNVHALLWQQLRCRVHACACVQDNLAEMLPAICNDLNAWQPERRVRAAALLRACLHLGEGAVAQHLDILLPAMAKVREAWHVGSLRESLIAVHVTTCMQITGLQP